MANRERKEEGLVPGKRNNTEKKLFLPRQENQKKKCPEKKKKRKSNERVTNPRMRNDALETYGACMEAAGSRADKECISMD